MSNYLMEMVKALIENDTTSATNLFSKYINKKSSNIVNEVYNTADGPHNNWGDGWEDEDSSRSAFDPDEDEFDIDPDDAMAYVDKQTDPTQGDFNMDDFEAGDSSAVELDDMVFNSQEEADYARELLAKWGIKSEVGGRPDRVGEYDKNPSPTDGDRYSLRFQDPDGSIRAALNDKFESSM